jgi:hypothetical protein
MELLEGMLLIENKDGTFSVTKEIIPNESSLYAIIVRVVDNKTCYVERVKLSMLTVSDGILTLNKEGKPCEK